MRIIHWGSSNESYYSAAVWDDPQSIIGTSSPMSSNMACLQKSVKDDEKNGVHQQWG